MKTPAILLLAAVAFTVPSMAFAGTRHLGPNDGVTAAGTHTDSGNVGTSSGSVSGPNGRAVSGTSTTQHAHGAATGTATVATTGGRGATANYSGHVTATGATGSGTVTTASGKTASGTVTASNGEVTATGTGPQGNTRTIHSGDRR